MNSTRALDEIDRLRALIAYRCTKDDIREIQEPIKADIAQFRGTVDALEKAFLVEGQKPNNIGRAQPRADMIGRQSIVCPIATHYALIGVA